MPGRLQESTRGLQMGAGVSLEFPGATAASGVVECGEAAGGAAQRSGVKGAAWDTEGGKISAAAGRSSSSSSRKIGIWRGRLCVRACAVGCVGSKATGGPVYLLTWAVVVDPIQPSLYDAGQRPLIRRTPTLSLFFCAPPRFNIASLMPRYPRTTTSLHSGFRHGGAACLPRPASRHRSPFFPLSASPLRPRFASPRSPCRCPTSPPSTVPARAASLIFSSDCGPTAWGSSFCI